VPTVPTAGRSLENRSRPRIEALLLKRGLVTAFRLEALAGRVAAAKRPLVEVLLEHGVLTEAQLVEAVAEESRMEPVPTADVRPSPDVQRMIPAEIAQRHGILPLRLDPDGSLVVVTADPFQIDVIDELCARVGRRIRVLLAAPSAVRAGLRDARLGEETFDEILRHAPVGPTSIEVGAAAAPEELEDDPAASLGVDVESAESPVVRFVNLMLADGIRQGASDIHVEPERDRVRLRFRIDGDLSEVRTLPSAVRSALVSRIKIVSGMDIMEHRRPQDGRATVRIDARTYDLRVSTLPSFFGEKVVIRILDAQAPTFSLDATGIAAPDLRRWRELIRRPNGMLLMTGPTGSGKTSTLYASLLELRDPKTNIVAIEDPVEFQFPGIVHVPIRAGIGLTFPSVLRTVLRQDPDIVLVGEIRDRETAEVALQGAMTGHLMLSTVHTNDAIGAVARLANLGVERDTLASSLIAIMAQRLVRTVCSECARPHRWPDDVLTQLGATPAELEAAQGRLGTGCARCRGTGFRGRAAIVELVAVTDALRELIATGAPEAALRAQAARDGAVDLSAAGLAAVLAGVTVPQEVLLVAGPRDRGVARALAPPTAPVAPDVAAVAAATRPCVACSKPLAPTWRACPHCGGAVAATARPTTAIVCDDDPLQRKVICAILRSRFDQVLEARDGRAAIDAIARERPDLLVIDHSMPELSGVDVIHRLRAQIDTATLPIVMLTAESGEELERTALDAGADDYLTKPVSRDLLIAHVNALLTAHRRIESATGGDPRR